MKPVVEIFSQGEEVISGQTVDSNAAWLSQKLVQMGFTITRHTAVGDNLVDLQTLLQEISTRADVCICTGGLGPTIDDLTTQAVAEAFARPLELDDIALEQITQFFANRKRTMVDSNRKQAYFPAGAERIDNAWGSAPGFSIQQQRCWFAFVPGVPFEMKGMFNEIIAEQLAQSFSLQADQLVTLRTVGIGESNIQEKLTDLSLPQNVQLSFRAGTDEVQTKLLFPANIEQPLQSTTVQQVADNIGDYVFAIDSSSKPQGGLVDIIAQLMQQQNLTLSVMETAAQGLIAAKCLGQPWLLSAAFNQAFHTATEPLSSVDRINSAIKIAQKIQGQDQADLVLVQSYHGSCAQFQNKADIITLTTLLLTPDEIRQSTHDIGGPAKRKQNQAAVLSLDLLRRYLQHKTAI
ncbi:MAG: nicotinamide-nucleotide amidase [Methyloprofundus sp.]|nr:MAG: nicotinamide-nucleotide amidase [Methyloprofundus sp.]